MVLFFCATPLQIYNAINLKEQFYNDKKCKLYIFDYFNGAADYVEKCKVKGVFVDVVLVKFFKISQRTNALKYKKSKLFGGVQESFFKILHSNDGLRNLYARLWAVYYYVLKNDVLKLTGIKKDEQIEEILFGHFDPIMQMLYLKLDNKNIEYNRFEDGTGTYFNGAIFPERKFDKWLKIGENIFIPKKVFVRIPEALRDYEEVKKTGTKIYKTDFSRNKKSKEILYDVFDIKNMAEIKERVIFFDTLFENQDMDAMINPLSRFTKQELVYKKHPRRKDDYYEKKGVNIYSGTSLPFEMYCEYFDVSDKILITHCSTACIAPALYFNQSPVSIICYDFSTTKANELYEHFDDFIDVLLEGDTPLRLHKPKTREEYEKLISTL
ncbi:MAG: hypothetical protein IKK46_01530 [Clostridia bacterium]|nr:hypothetical protein [Clostridia bacterium]